MRSSRPETRSRRYFRSISPTRAPTISEMSPARCARSWGDSMVWCTRQLSWDRWGPVEHQSFDAWQAALRVNVSAAMALTRATMPLLAQAADASIVFTLDSRGVDPRAHWGGYAASKAALGAFAATLADESEHRPALRVNAVIPGPIRSPLRNRTHPGEEKSALAPPEALTPLYLYLIGAQPKAESGVRIDAQAWLAGQPASTPLVGAPVTGKP